MSFRPRFAALVVACIFALVPAVAHAAAPPSGQPVVVAVKDPAHMSAVKAAIEREGGTVKRSLRWNALVVQVPAGQDAARFADSIDDVGGVRYAQESQTLHMVGTATDPSFPQQWGLPAIGAPAAWDSADGAGVSVAVIDTGIDANHADLKGNVVLFRNYVTPGASAQDDQGHGTHVAGIIAALRNNGVDGAGTAPAAKLYALKVLDSQGSGSDYAVATAIRDAVDQTPARIISMSLGGPADGGSNTALADAVAYARSKGALVIAATGNDGVSDTFYPAGLPGVLGVGAVDSGRARASFSNWGVNNVDIMAPGVGILSSRLGGGMVSYSGTSMATPFVSGAAALVWSKRPELTADGVAALLKSTAQDLGAAGFDQYYGAGLVRPDRALAGAVTPGGGGGGGTVGPSSLTIGASPTSVYLPRPFVLSGVLTPGAVGDPVVVWVQKPGTARWSYSSARLAYASNAGGGALWWYRYAPKSLGTYRFQARFAGDTDTAASVSSVIGVRVR